MRESLTRLRRAALHPLLLDSLLALLLACMSLGSMIAGPVFTDYRPLDALGVALALIAAVPIAIRRVYPIPVLVVSGAATIAIGWFQYNDIAGLPVLFALYTVATHTDRKTSLHALAYTGVGIAATILVQTTEHGFQLANIISSYIVFGTVWLIGDNLRGRREQFAQLEERASILERERGEMARLAVAEERTRIARELHDVVAHHVSVMVVQAGGARRVLDDRPEEAREAMTAIEATGRQALAEMRRVVGVLRTDVVLEPREPQPTLDRLEELLGQVRDAGLPVELVVEGEPRTLPAGIDLSAYRIVQEALTNALKHAGRANSRVRLRYGRDDLEIEISDDGRGAAAALHDTGARPGHGLIGMRERVALFGGRLDAGPRASGGYVVSAHLPLDAEPRAAT